MPIGGPIAPRAAYGERAGTDLGLPSGGARCCSLTAMNRVMIVIDSYRVSGPAKGLLDLCDAARGYLEPLIVVFQRGGRETTEFREACARRKLQVEVLWERYRFDPSLLAQARRV